MIEPLECRQFLSATLTADALVATEPAPAATVDSGATSTSSTSTARKAGGGQQEYLVIKFKEVRVDTISW